MVAIFDFSQFPRKPLANIPTRLSRAPRFSEKMEGPDIWIKRDDETGLATGGNKTRKLEFLLGEALQKGADTVLTCGGVQSNHCRITAAAAIVCGMRPILFLTGDEPEGRQGNLLLDELMSAEIRFIGDRDADEAMAEHADRLRGEGRSPYVIPLGGSVPVGCLGYVDGGLELISQCVAMGIQLDHVILAGGSGGTAAGLLVALLDRAPGAKLHVVSVSRESEVLRERILELAGDTAELLNCRMEGLSKALRVYDEFIGEGYAIPTREGTDAAHLLAGSEGIIVDTTYTGKALAGLVSLCRGGVFARDEEVVFVHTGGVPAVFDETEAFAYLWSDGD